jgi:Na+/phosphate symporter
MNRMEDKLDEILEKAIDSIVEEEGQTGSLSQKIKNWLIQISKGSLSDDDHEKQYNVISSYINTDDNR